MEITSSSVPDRDWNNDLLRSSTGSIYQTSYFAEVEKKTLEWKPLYVSVWQGNDRLASLLLFSSPRLAEFRLGREGENRYVKRLTSALTRFTSPIRVFRWYYGPVFRGGVETGRVETALGLFLSRNLRGPLIEGLSHPLYPEVKGFEEAGFVRTQRATILIDLRKQLSELWADLAKNSARKNVERAVERGVEIEEIRTKQDFAEYCTLSADVRKRLGLPAWDYESLRIFWTILHRNGIQTGFLARKSGRALAGILISVFNGYLNEWGAVNSAENIQNRLYANDLLKWHTIKWTKEHDCFYYDVTGVNINPKNAKESGILRFKSKWGGNVQRFNSYSL